MGQIIDVKEKLHNKGHEEPTADELIIDEKTIEENLKKILDTPDLMRCELNGLSSRVRKNFRGGYAITVEQKDPATAVFVTVNDLNDAVYLFRRIEDHIIAGDRNYTELVGILNTGLSGR